MDVTLLASLSLLFSIFAIIGGFIAKLWWDEREAKRRVKELLAMDLGNQATKSGKDGRAATGRQHLDRGATQRKTNNAEPISSQSEEEGEEEMDETGTASAQLGAKKIGKKKQAKLQAKAEAKAIREQEQAEREERKRQDELKAAEEAEAKRLEDLEELKKKELARAEQEERRRIELEEYEKLKRDFVVEEHGYDQPAEEDNGSLMKAFIDYVKRAKVVYIDELASHFRLPSTNDVVKRLEMLAEENLLTGVFDDRGKFVYISEEEMSAVAAFINQRGRVSIQELAEYSNRLICLDSKLN